MISKIIDILKLVITIICFFFNGVLKKMSPKYIKRKILKKIQIIKHSIKKKKLNIKAKRITKDIITVTQACTEFNLSRSKVYILIKSKKIHAFKSEGVWKLRRDHLKKYLKETTS